MRRAIDPRHLKDMLLFWEHLNEEQRRELSQNVVLHNFSSKQILYSANHDCFGVFVVVSGRLRVFMHSPQGRELTVFRIEKSQMCALAASCVLHSIKISISIEADENSVVLSINSEFFSRLIDSNLFVENFMYKIALEKFSDLMSCVEHIMFDSVEKRLAEFLIRDCVNEELHITHEEIANHIGSAREVVSRTIKRFAKSGWISYKRGYIKILNENALKEIDS